MIYNAHAALSACRGKMVIEWIDTLAPEISASWRVLTLLACAYYELAEHARAVEIFKRIRSVNPFQIQAMDIYGTCLWHQKQKAELCALGKILKEHHPKAPQTWCVIGNHYSLITEHEAAITSFKKAIEFDSQFPYSHALLGHEYLATEDLDRAAECFKSAVQIKPRFYNSMYASLR